MNGHFLIKYMSYNSFPSFNPDFAGAYIPH